MIYTLDFKHTEHFVISIHDRAAPTTSCRCSFGTLLRNVWDYLDLHKKSKEMHSCVKFYCAYQSKSKILRAERVID